MVKVVSLSDEAYERLRSLKREKSFSDIVIELVENKPSKNIMELAGVWSDNSDEWLAIEKKISEDRRKFRLR